MEQVNSLSTSGEFCHLLMIFANILDPDQAQKNIGPDLDPICLTCCYFRKNILKEVVLKNICRQQKSHEKLPSMQKVNCDTQK